MKIWNSMMYQWHWRQLYQTRRTLRRLTALHGLQDPRVLRQNKRADRLCAALLRQEAGRV